MLTTCRNRFSSLNVEDVEDADLSPAQVVLAARPDTKKVDIVDVYEPEAEQAFDNALPSSVSSKTCTGYRNVSFNYGKNAKLVKSVSSRL
jgi:hypothetical protein